MDLEDPELSGGDFLIVFNKERSGKQSREEGSAALGPPKPYILKEPIHFSIRKMPNPYILKGTYEKQ